METIGIVLIRCGLSDFTAWRLKLLGAVLRIEDARLVFRDVLQVCRCTSMPGPDLWKG